MVKWLCKDKVQIFGRWCVGRTALKEFLLGILIGLVQRQYEIKFLRIIHDFHLLSNIDTTINWDLFFSHIVKEDFRQQAQVKLTRLEEIKESS